MCEKAVIKVVGNIELTIGELDLLARLCEQKARKIERELQKSTFVPEPGRADMKVLYIKSHRDLAAKLQVAVQELVLDRKHRLSDET